MNYPSLLKAGDHARIIAPSGLLGKEGITNSIETLNKWDLKVEVAIHVFDGYHTFSSSDENRLSDFQKALDDPSVNMILCARGGYGLTRILDGLSFETYLKHPKWVVGYSDITAFLQKAFNSGIGTIHGPMGTSFGRRGAEESIVALRNLLFKGSSVIETKARQIKTGKAKGQLIGGNLALVCDSLGTKIEIETDNRILVLEDVGEYYYRIDRMLTQLERAGKFSKLRGLVVGSFSQLLNGEVPFGETIFEMVNRLTSKYGYPIAINMPIGHEPNNFPFIYGAEYKLSVEEDSAKLDLITKI